MTDDRWEMQEFFHDYGDGRAASSVGYATFNELLTAVALDVPKSEAEVFLIRRGPQVEAGDGTIGPYRLVSADNAGERELIEVIDERDGYHSAADQLAAALAKVLGVEIGEHSSENDPWRRALHAARDAGPIEARARAEDPKSCSHANVTTLGGEWEHYDRVGPGCWHPVAGGQCRSWQALIEHVQNVAAAWAQARVRAEVADERDQDRAALAAVQGAVHTVHRQVIDSSWPAPGHCVECWDQLAEDYRPWPCPTVVAVSSATGRAGSSRGTTPGEVIQFEGGDLEWGIDPRDVALPDPAASLPRRAAKLTRPNPDEGDPHANGPAAEEPNHLADRRALRDHLRDRGRDHLAGHPMTAATYRRTVEVQAVQWTGNNGDAIHDLVGFHCFEVIDEDDRANLDDADATAGLLESKHSNWVTLVNSDWVVVEDGQVRRMSDTEFRADFPR